MRAKTTLTGLMTTSLMIAGSQVALAQNNNPLSLSLEAGAAYDNNITVDAKDQVSKVGDESALFQGAIAYQLKNDNNFKLKTGYSFYQSLYQSQTAFNLQIHGLSVSTSTKLGRTTLGASYRYNYIKLGSQNFLDIHSVGPSISFQAAKKLFVTLSYEYQRQNFKQATLTRRDANRNSFNSLFYYPLSGGKSLNFGYKLSRHTTRDTVLSYWSNTLTAGVKLPFDMAGKKVTFRGRYRYRNKSFLNLDPAIGAKRKDNRHTLRASLETPFFDKILAKLQYEYIDSSSNLASITYTEHVVTFTFRWKL